MADNASPKKSYLQWPIVVSAFVAVVVIIVLMHVAKMLWPAKATGITATAYNALAEADKKAYYFNTATGYYEKTPA